MTDRARPGETPGESAALFEKERFDQFFSRRLPADGFTIRALSAQYVVVAGADTMLLPDSPAGTPGAKQA